MFILANGMGEGVREPFFHEMGSLLGDRANIGAGVARFVLWMQRMPRELRNAAAHNAYSNIIVLKVLVGCFP